MLCVAVNVIVLLTMLLTVVEEGQSAHSILSAAAIRIGCGLARSDLSGQYGS